MAKEDEEKTAFITSQGIFCYSKMPFGLRNAGATYQRLVDRAFQKQTGRNLEVYVDDLVIKSRMEEEIIRDIEETFKTLWQINMKLNLKKCTFGMQEGMFLGYKVNTDGLKVCPDKANAVLSLPSPRCLKDVQKLNGKLASLNRFLSKSAKKSLPFFKTLKKCTEKDRSSCIDSSRSRLILTNSEGVEFTYAMRFKFKATNNEVEYKALIAGLRIAEQMGVKNLQANVDSRLVANQVSGSYVAKEPGMVQYFEKVKTLTSNFKEFSIKQVPRSENKKADALSKIVSTSFAHLNKQVLVEELKEKSIDEKEVLAILEEEGHTRMTPICEYLTKEILLEDKNKARAGIDIAGPFPEGPGKVKFLIVAIDYYTKWIEAKPVATITGNQVKKFVWDNIVCRFGLPGEIVSDNGRQFRDNPFKDWCEKLCIRQCFASVKHPQANGLVERANRSLGEGIKARLDERSKDWIGELSHVL
ncbi:reverse transcriptase domain-containing protein [Tanacetum coccineum]